MADASDVENALVAAVEAVRVQVGGAWSIYRGWPSQDALNREMAAGDVHITITSRSGYSINDTRLPNEEVELPRVPPSLTVYIAGQAATFAGTCSPDQIAGVQVGNDAYVVRCQAGDTPISVASALATMVGGSAVNAVLTVAGLVAAHTDRDGGTLRPTRQMQKGFIVTVWASTPEDRDTVSSAIDAALSDVKFLYFQDGSAGQLIYNDSHPSDHAENATIYRRDLFYTVHYSTVIAAVRTPVLFAGALVTEAGATTQAGASHP